MPLTPGRTRTTTTSGSSGRSETRPDSSIVTVFTNYIGQVILHELSDAAGSKKWRTYHEYNSEGREILNAHPSAVSTWSLANLSSNLSVTLRTSDGLIEVTDYASSTTATETAAGDVTGYQTAAKIKKGSSGSEIMLREMQYFQRTVDGESVNPLARETVYRNDNGTGEVDTDYSYTWFSGQLIFEERVTTLPAIATGQNGSNSSNTRTERYSDRGELLWSMDERGFITRNTYDSVKGGLVQTIVDVDHTLVSTPSGWTTPSGGGLHLVTDYTLDDRGRVTMTKGPVHAIDLSGTSTNVRSISTTLYKDDADEVRTAGLRDGDELRHLHAVQPDLDH